MPVVASTRSTALREDIHRGKPERVDRAAGIIYGVRVLGLQSENGRRYLPEAVKSAIPMYEGRSVRIDHPNKPTDNRPVTSTFGRLVRVRLDKDGGLRADLEFIKAHPLAEFVCEVAERMSEQLGLSHNATGEGDTVRGIFEVREIKEVRSVDIVTEPATTRSLFESRGTPMKFADLVERLHPAADRLTAHNRLRSLLEDDFGMDMGADVPAEMAPADDAGAGDWKADLVAAIGKLVAGEDGADHDMAKKIMAMLKPGGAKPAATSEEDESDDKDKKDDEKKVEEECDDDKEKMKESRDLKAKLIQAQAELHVRDLCEELGVKVPAELREGILLLPTDKRKKALEKLKDAMSVQESRGKPRTQIPDKGGTSSRVGDSAADDFEKSYRAGLRSLGVTVANK